MAPTISPPLIVQNRDIRNIRGNRALASDRQPAISATQEESLRGCFDRSLTVVRTTLQESLLYQMPHKETCECDK